jgi:hypothetical protein
LKEIEHPHGDVVFHLRQRPRHPDKSHATSLFELPNRIEGAVLLNGPLRG